MYAKHQIVFFVDMNYYGEEEITSSTPLQCENFLRQRCLDHDNHNVKAFLNLTSKPPPQLLRYEGGKLYLPSISAVQLRLSVQG